MSDIALVFTSDGTGRALYTEAIDLACIGQLSIRRATEIEFDNKTQSWRVYDSTGFAMFHSPSRQACLDWERGYLETREDARHAA